MPMLLDLPTQRPVAGRVTYIAAPDSAAFGFITPGTLAVLVAEDDEPLLDRFAEAATTGDAALMTEAAQHLGARTDGARLEKIELSASTRVVGDVLYAGRVVARDVVIDARLRFNFIALEYHGGELDPQLFSINGLAVVPEARPLHAVIVARPAILTDIEMEAVRQVPPRERAAKIYLATKRRLVDNVGDRVRDLAANRRNLANDLDIDRIADLVADRVADRIANRLDDRVKNIDKRAIDRAIERPAARRRVAALDRGVQQKAAGIRDRARALDRDLDVDRAGLAQRIDRANLDRGRLQQRIADRGPIRKKSEAFEGDQIASLGSEATVDELLALRNALLREQQ